MAYRRTVPTILTAHLGYDTTATKKAIVLTDSPVDVHSAVLVGPTWTDLVVGPEQHVDRWSVGGFRRIDFSHVHTPGTYRLDVHTADGAYSSTPFPIGDGVTATAISDCLNYFKAVRSTGEIDRKDRTAGFYGGSDRTVDARGGWLDASGDFSKFLSHLNYTRMMSPQQIPLCTWAFFAADSPSPVLRTRLRDEGLHGADFLVRFQSPEGYFYTAIFDALTKDLNERVITAPLQDSVRTTRWQAAFRHGGGLAIAALARASTANDHGDFPNTTYLAAAQRGFTHLESHNTSYLYDGTETVLDDYCALLAATELVAAGLSSFQSAAERRCKSLVDRYRSSGLGFGYLRGDADGRPFFHAAEPGLPIVALLRYAEVCSDPSAVDLAVRLARDTVCITDEVANPFGYVRQYVQPLGAAPRTAFFFPHANETGYWWQGENAGICSMAYAARLVAALPECDESLRDRLRRLADDQLQWVLGLNPFDTCMLQGRGRNQADYSSDYPNVPGGILNGITGGVKDERDIAFLPEGEDRWRWAEQWIPHSAWFVLAASA